MMDMYDFAKEVDGNMKFIALLIQFVDVPNISGKIRVFDESGTDLKIEVVDAAFSRKKRKGLDIDKAYFFLQGLSSDMSFEFDSRALTIKGLLDIYFEGIDENNVFQSPVLVNKSTGAYYKVIGMGQDVYHNVIFWVKAVKFKGLERGPIKITT